MRLVAATIVTRLRGPVGGIVPVEANRCMGALCEFRTIALAISRAWEGTGRVCFLKYGNRDGRF